MSIENSYRVTVKVRNANLLRAIEKAGYSPGQKFADLAGIAYIHLNDLINMTRKPTDRHGDLHPAVESLCAFLGAMPSNIFDAHQMHNALVKNRSDVDLNLDDLASIQAKTSPHHLQSAVDQVVETLTDNESLVIKLRFGIEGREHTLKEIGEIIGVTQERVRQIEAKALRKLRSPARSDLLIKAIDNTVTVGTGA
jgi:RNA polymerase primary sigma factor